MLSKISNTVAKHLPHWFSKPSVKPAPAAAPAISWNAMIIVAVTLLLLLGALMVYGASAMRANYQVGDPSFFVKKQLVSVLIGAAAIVLMQKISLRTLEKLALPLAVGMVFVLSLVFIPGVYHSAGGATRWLQGFGLRFQPSEFAKPIFVLFLSRLFAAPSFQPRRYQKGLLMGVITLGLFCLPILRQPDYGCVAMLAVLFLALLFVAGVRLKVLGFAGLALAIVMGLLVIVAPYRVARLMVFLNPWEQMQGRGFQVVQSFLAFANGGLWGLGLGESRQKLHFLPEAHTDFLFSVFGEEFGFLGVLVLLGFFWLLFHAGYQIAVRQDSLFAKLLALGLTLFVILQAVFNMDVCLGILPTKGLPLPLLSNGSNNLLATLCSIGILIRLGRIKTRSMKSASPSSHARSKSAA